MFDCDKFMFIQLAILSVLIVVQSLVTLSTLQLGTSAFQRNTPNRLRSRKPLHVSTERSVIRDEGAASKQFDWSQQWYPLAVDEFTDKSRSHALMLLGNNVVLWHDGARWSVFEDACPHRGVPLSEGTFYKYSIPSLSFILL